MVTSVRCAYRPPGGSIRHPCTTCGRLFTLQRLGQEQCKQCRRATSRRQRRERIEDLAAESKRLIDQMVAVARAE